MNARLILIAALLASAPAAAQGDPAPAELPAETPAETPAVDLDRARARGSWAVEAFLRGDSAAFWAASTPDLQAALGSAAALAETRKAAMDQFGEEAEILSEEIEEREGYGLYTRLARWTNSAAPLEILTAVDQEARIAGFVIRARPIAAPNPHLAYETKARLRLPFEGAWFVYWGGREIEANYHAANPQQRFAMDVMIRKDGLSHAGDPAVLENYHCWNQPILAPADGIAARAVDGFPDLPIGEMDPQNPAGNHVVIDFGNGEYGFLAHLRRGSLTVETGDPVLAGQEIGRCGNSGNTSEPHLHIHLQTSVWLDQGHGLPMPFVDYLADGAFVARGEPQKGQTIRPAE